MRYWWLLELSALELLLLLSTLELQKLVMLRKKLSVTTAMQLFNWTLLLFSEQLGERQNRVAKVQAHQEHLLKICSMDRDDASWGFPPALRMRKPCLCLP